MRPQIKKVLPAIAGAILASGLCVAVAVAFLDWRNDAQQRFLGERKKSCETGVAGACDLLRSACLKRSGEGCVALADTYLAPGPRHDAKEGARLLADACDYQIVDACRRAASLYAEGREVPEDRERSGTLARHACDLGDKTACSMDPGTSAGASRSSP